METNERITPIDRFRGIIIFCMILFQYIDRYSCFGWLTKIARHSPDRGIVLLNNFTLADIGAPIFFYVMAMNLVPSFRRRAARDGEKAAYLHFVQRSLAITGFGACISTIDDVFAGSMNLYLKLALVMTGLCLLSGILSLIVAWVKPFRGKQPLFRKLFQAILAVFGLINMLYGCYCLIPQFRGESFYASWQVLQAIGEAELIALLFVKLSTAGRGIAAAVILAAYTLLHEQPGMMEMIDIEVQGGILGGFAWASMMLFFTVYADLYYKDRAAHKEGKKAYRYLLGLAAGAVTGVIGYLLFYVNKGSVSPGYVLVTVPLSALLFLIPVALGEKKFRFAPITWWGENPILMFLFQYIFVNIVVSVLPGAGDWTLLPASLYAVFLVAVITWIAYSLDRKKKMVRL